MMRAMTERGVWVAWEPRGRDPYSNPRATTAHYAAIRPLDRTGGGYPLACGRIAPDGLDALIREAPYARRCRRCVKARGGF